MKRTVPSLSGLGYSASDPAFYSLYPRPAPATAGQDYVKELTYANAGEAAGPGYSLRTGKLTCPCWRINTRAQYAITRCVVKR